MKTKTIYVRKGPNSEPTRLTGKKIEISIILRPKLALSWLSSRLNNPLNHFVGSNGNSYEIKGVVNQPIRKAITIVNKNNSNNYSSTPRIVTSSYQGRLFAKIPLNQLEPRSEPRSTRLRDAEHGSARGRTKWQSTSKESGMRLSSWERGRKKSHLTLNSIIGLWITLGAHPRNQNLWSN